LAGASRSPDGSMALKFPFPFSIEVAGNLLSLRREQRLGRKHLAELQGRLLARLARAAAGTEHYRRALSGIDISSVSLDSLPITEKSEIRRRPGAFIPGGRAAPSLSVNQTSGSTGEPVRVYSDSGSVRWRAAFGYMNLLDAGVSPADLTVSIQRRVPVPGRARSLYGLFRAIDLSAFDLESDNFARLRKIRPHYLICPPSYGALLASLNAKAGHPLRLKGFLSCAESLSRASRDSIRNSFSCPVFDTYGNYECGIMGWECPEAHRMHIVSRVMLETVDERGRPANGKMGHILATPLHNLAMPLLRYRVGDLGRLGAGCACGRSLPVLESLDGRAEDMMVLPDGRTRSAVCICNIDSMNPCSTLYQVVQESRERFIIRYVPSGVPLDGRMKKEAIRDIREACLGAQVSVGFEKMERIPPGPGGKFRKFVSFAFGR